MECREPGQSSEEAPCVTIEKDYYTQMEVVCFPDSVPAWSVPYHGDFHTSKLRSRAAAVAAAAAVAVTAAAVGSAAVVAAVSR